MRGVDDSLNVITTILEELQAVCQNISKVEYEKLVALLQEDRIFYFAGEGRSGLVAKTIAMRLMHSGKEVYVIGETITPAIEKEDVLMMLSGSGKTNQVIHLGEKAAECGADVFLVTTNKQALNYSWCTKGLYIPAATKYRLPEEPATIQPLGNQYDQSAHIILDAAIIDSLQMTNAHEKMNEKHTNLE